MSLPRPHIVARWAMPPIILAYAFGGVTGAVIASFCLWLAAEKTDPNRGGAGRG